MTKIGSVIRCITAYVFTGICISLPISEYLNGSQPYVVAVTAFMGFSLWLMGVSILGRR